MQKIETVSKVCASCRRQYFSTAGSGCPSCEKPEQAKEALTGFPDAKRFPLGARTVLAGAAAEFAGYYCSNSLTGADSGRMETYAGSAKANSAGLSAWLRAHDYDFYYDSTNNKFHVYLNGARVPSVTEPNGVYVPEALGSATEFTTENSATAGAAVRRLVQAGVETESVYSTEGPKNGKKMLHVFKAEPGTAAHAVLIQLPNLKGNHPRAYLVTVIPSEDNVAEEMCGADRAGGRGVVVVADSPEAAAVKAVESFEKFYRDAGDPEQFDETDKDDRDIDWVTGFNNVVVAKADDPTYVVGYFC